MFWKPYEELKSIIKNDAHMKFYNEKCHYTSNCQSGIGLGADLLQVWNGVQFPSYETPDNIALHPIVFACKSLTSKRSTSNTTWIREVPPLLLFPQVQCYKRSQTIFDNLQEGCSNPVTEVMENPAVHPSIQNKEPIQARTTTIQSWLVVKAE